MTDERLKELASNYRDGGEMRAVFDELIESRALLRQRQWVSVEERLPTEGQRVLVWVNDNEPSHAVWEYEANSSSWKKFITDWQPLPGRPPSSPTPGQNRAGGEEGGLA